MRLERPNRVQLTSGPTSGNTIVLSSSTDLLHWEPVSEVASGRFHYWDELIGSGPVPVKTREGWLAVYHGVATHFSSSNIYQAGVMLLDLENPGRVLARSRYNILEPRETWELTGQVPNVVFPSGLIVESYDEQGFAQPDSAFKLYYGAADTVVGLVTGQVEELIAAARS
jgi:beta-1,4-mannooligosaccharide/beta-1,4-mannosyl-N-acetylglucosamine phosphorylase